MTQENGERFRSERNPIWTRDELILALDFYLKHRDALPSVGSAELDELTRSVNLVASLAGLRGNSNFRNHNGVYMKLNNFRRLDPSYTSSGKKGLSRGGKNDEVIWEEFALDPKTCGDAALIILRDAEAAGKV